MLTRLSRAALVTVAVGVALSLSLGAVDGAGAATSTTTTTATHGSNPRAAVVSSGNRSAEAHPNARRPARLPVDQLHLMSYAPVNAPWLKMWQNYDHAQVDNDFAGIRALGANAVRIVVPPAGVGWPTISATGAADLRDMINTASAHGLAVQLTLFDWSDPWNQINDSITWMRSVVAPYANDPRIALVEVRTEIDVDNPVVRSWTRTMLAQVATMLPGVPRTVSVAGQQTMAQLTTLNNAIPPSLLDVIDIHLYGVQSVVEGKLDNALAIAGNRPVFVGEMGLATQDQSACSNAAQAAFFQRMGILLAQRNISGFGVWTYTDFTQKSLPPSYVGTQEGYFGLRTTTGQYKPAASVVRSLFAQPSASAMRVQLANDTASSVYSYVDSNFSCTPTSVPSSSTTYAADKWVVFDAKDVAAAGAVAGQGVNGTSAGFLRGAAGDLRTGVPSLMYQFPVMSARPITAGAVVRLDHATGSASMSIAWFKGSQYLGNAQAKILAAPSAGWQPLTVTSTPPAGATNFQVHLQSWSNSGTAYFDQVSVGEAS